MLEEPIATSTQQTDNNTEHAPLDEFTPMAGSTQQSIHSLSTDTDTSLTPSCHLKISIPQPDWQICNSLAATIFT